MKKSILYLFLLLALPAMAQRPFHATHGSHGGGSGTASSLTIIAPRNHNFWLFVDNVLQNDDPVHSIRINNMYSDDFYIRVEFDNENQDCIGRFINLTHSQTFNVSQSGHMFGFEPVQGNFRPVLVMDLLTEKPLPPMPPAPPGDEVQPPMPPMPNPEFGMNPNDFDQALVMLSKETFDNTRLVTAKQIISNNPMTVNQIAEICRLFNYESNRLDFAKYAYPYCVEKNKYYMLNEVFTYDSSKRELNEYIQGL